MIFNCDLFFLNYIKIRILIFFSVYVGDKIYMIIDMWFELGVLNSIM